jgi:hypothetical protein
MHLGAVAAVPAPPQASSRLELPANLVNVSYATTCTTLRALYGVRCTLA